MTDAAGKAITAAAKALLACATSKHSGRNVAEDVELDVIFKAMHPPDKKIGFLSGAKKGKAQETIRRRASWLRELPQWQEFTAAHGERLAAELERRALETKAARAQRAAAAAAADSSSSASRQQQDQQQPEEQLEQQPGHDEQLDDDDSFVDVAIAIEHASSEEQTASSEEQTAAAAAGSNIYVKGSTIKGAGGGAFASRKLPRNHPLCKYAGIAVDKEVAFAPGYRRGYVMRVGGPYFDARDPDGMLILQDGRHISVHEFTDADWANLSSIGVAWDGVATLSRFFNQATEAGTANIVYRNGWWRTTQEVKAHQELLVSRRGYGGDFWKDGSTSWKDGSSSAHSAHNSCGQSEAHNSCGQSEALALLYHCGLVL